MFETFGIFGEADTMPQVALCFGEGGGIVGNRKRSRPLRQQAFICDARHTFVPAGRSKERSQVRSSTMPTYLEPEEYLNPICSRQ
jgi:hypothetical protein